MSGRYAEYNEKNKIFMNNEFGKIVYTYELANRLELLNSNTKNIKLEDKSSDAVFYIDYLLLDKNTNKITTVTGLILYKNK